MSISPDLMYAILALDAYNRGYDPGIEYVGNSIGTATIDRQSETLESSPEVGAGFYAVSYKVLGSLLDLPSSAR